MAPVALPCWKQEGIFLWYLLWEHGKLQEAKHRVPLWLSLSGVFNPQICPHWASPNLSITVQVFPPGTGSPVVSPHKTALVNPSSLDSPVCLHFGGGGLPCVLFSLMDPRRVVCPASYLLLGQSCRLLKCGSRNVTSASSLLKKLLRSSRQGFSFHLTDQNLVIRLQGGLGSVVSSLSSNVLSEETGVPLPRKKGKWILGDNWWWWP